MTFIFLLLWTRMQYWCNTVVVILCPTFSFLSFGTCDNGSFTTFALVVANRYSSTSFALLDTCVRLYWYCFPLGTLWPKTGCGCWWCCCSRGTIAWFFRPSVVACVVRGLLSPLSPLTTASTHRLVFFWAPPPSHPDLVIRLFVFDVSSLHYHVRPRGWWMVRRCVRRSRIGDVDRVSILLYPPLWCCFS